MEDKIKGYEKEYDENMRVFIEDVAKKLDEQVQEDIKKFHERAKVRDERLTTLYGK